MRSSLQQALARIRRACEPLHAKASSVSGCVSIHRATTTAGRTPMLRRKDRRRGSW